MKLNPLKKFIYIFAIFMCMTAVNNVQAQLLNEVMPAVVFLQNDGHAIGTGFFITADNNAYLVTAAHVAKKLTLRATGTISLEGDRPFNFKITELTPLQLFPPWQYSAIADLAVLRISPNEQLIKSLRYHFLPLSAVKKEKQAPSRDITITIIGFPLGLGSGEYFSPISVETKPASGLISIEDNEMKDEKGNSKKCTYFLTQNPSIGGYSGGPVFDLGQPYNIPSGMTFRTATLQLVGIVKGTLSDQTGGKLGAMIPSYILREMIDN